MNPHFTLGISLPYPERAARAIADVSASKGSLGRTYSPAARRARLIERPTPTTTNKSGFTTLRRLGNASRSRRGALAAMHGAKVLFDRSVSARIHASDAAILGFPGASLSTFRAVPAHTTRVFHAVDAHPRWHNESLLQYYPRRRVAAELYPNWLVNRIEAEMLCADIILVPSFAVASQMTRYGVPSDKVIIEPYGVDFGLFESHGVDSPASASTWPTLVYVGQISLRKGIPFALEAIAGTRVHLKLIGNVFDRRIVKSLPNNVELIPPLPHPQLARHLAAADAFLLPTVEDACSLVALEAVSAGLPVITTSANGAVEVLPKSAVTVVPPGDTTALRQAAEAVGLLSPAERARIGQDARHTPTLRNWAGYGQDVLHALITAHDGRRGLDSNSCA